jgi:hypothetical protein
MQDALRLLGRLEGLVANMSEGFPEKVSQAFWHACTGEQPRAEEPLLDRDADMRCVRDHANGTVIESWGAHSAKSGGEQAS